MTTYYTGRVSDAIPPRMQEKGVFCEVATYEFAGEAAASVVQLCKVAANVTVLDGYIIYDALGGTGTTIDVGDGDVPTRYIEAAAVDAAAGLTRFALGATGGAVFPFTYSADDTIDATVGVDAPTGTLTAVIFMTREPVDLT